MPTLCNSHFFGVCSVQDQSSGFSQRKTRHKTRIFLSIKTSQPWGGWGLKNVHRVREPWFHLRFYKSYYIPYSKSVSPPDSAASSVILVSISSNPLSTAIFHPLSPLSLFHSGDSSLDSRKILRLLPKSAFLPCERNEGGAAGAASGRRGSD